MKSAFVNSKLTEVVYLHQPPGYVVPTSETLVCHLHRAIYDLCQSLCTWHQKLDMELQALGLLPCPSDPGLYVLYDHDIFLLLIIYIVDLMITGNNSIKIQWLQSQLCTKFAMSLLGPLSLYLGVNFYYNPSGILMSHHRYILGSLDELGLSQCYPTSIPMDPRLFATLSIHISTPLLTSSTITYYQCGVGKLIHVLNTRPDVAFATGVGTCFTSTSCEAHLHAMLQIWPYLRGTPDLALNY